jgi:16S rRNA (guanine527-N7)-methyltransferase
VPLAQVAATDSRLLDIGSGAGVPGLVVAALRADMHVTCAESAAKKAAFLVQAASAMKLTNVRVEAIRAEKLAERFDLITARAVAKPDELIERFAHLLRPGGGFAFFLAAGDEGCDLGLCRTRQEIEYSLPNNAGDRKLVLAQIARSATR